MPEEKKVAGFIKPKDYKPPTMRDVVNLINIGILDQAENVFARIMKRRLSDIVGANIKRTVDPNLVAHPCWVLSESVCVLVTDDDTKPAELVLSCINRLGNTIVTEAGENAVMMGALYTRIHNLGKGFYNFVVKQKFTVGHATPEEAIESAE